MFGGIHRYKGISESIDAFSRLAEPGAVLIIAGEVGDPSLGEEIRAASEKRDDIIYRPGLVPDDMVDVYLNASDVVMLPYPARGNVVDAGILGFRSLYWSRETCMGVYTVC